MGSVFVGSLERFRRLALLQEHGIARATVLALYLVTFEI
jgi:hypothetical protein